MRVAIICGSYPPVVCGVADYTISLAKAVSAHDVDVDIWTTEGLHTRSVQGVSARGAFTGWAVRDVRRGFLQIRQARPDLVHIQFPAEVYHGAFGIHILPCLLRRTGIPVVTTLHEYCQAPWGGRLKQLVNVFFSHYVIVTNQQDELLLSRWAGSKIVRIPIGSNIPVYTTAMSREDIKKKFVQNPATRWILFFGFVRPGKGIETLLEAFAQFRRPELRLVFAGPPPEREYRSILDSMAEKLKIKESVIWLGYLSPDDISLVFQASSMAVLPFVDGATERRGSLLSALQHGLPVVTTQGPFTPSLFRDGVNMSVVDTLEPGEIADRMRRLLDEPEYADTLRRGALDVAAGFEWSSIAESTIEVYRETLQAGNPV